MEASHSAMDDSQVDVGGNEDTIASSSGFSGPIRRACDACRSRKIRCNRESPCSHCIHAKIECTHADNKPREKRTRILLTPQYERKIDLIDRRLDGVIRLLEDLKMNWPTSSGPPPAPLNEMSSCPKTMTMSTESTPGSLATHPESKEQVVEGESSLAAHSAFANEFLQNVVNTDALQDSSLEMRETLDALHHIVNSLKQPTVSSEMRYPNAKPLPRPSLSGCEMPPFEKAAALIQYAKTKRMGGMSWVYEFLPIQNFPDLCLTVYFSQDYTEAEFISVNAGLYELFWDYSHHLPEAEKEDALCYSYMCRDNLETALASLPLNLPATSGVIVALLFGTFYAIEISKPSLAWTLSSKASELCQTLGYHRIVSMKKDSQKDAEYKQFLFWSVYFVDKSLSLRLGRTSTIQDWDVTIPRPNPNFPNDPGHGPLLAYFVLWVEAARCQGDIYAFLYSPDSTTQPAHIRQSRVQMMVKRLDELAVKTAEANSRWAKEATEVVGKELIDFFVISDEVLRLSLVTLVYRAAPRSANSATTFSEDCTQAARATLERHQDCMVVLDKGGSMLFPTYVHWTILFAPFVPFIVLFCQVIETQDQADLARLHAFNTSMQAAHTVSEAAGKMCRLFQVLYSVALRYVEFKNSAPEADMVKAGAEMDAYLSALGFPSTGLSNQQQQQIQQQQQQPSQPSQQQQMSNDLGQGFDQSFLGVGVDGADASAANTNPMMWMGNAAQLDDWFYSQSQMMGLLQEPNFNFPDSSQN